MSSNDKRDYLYEQAGQALLDAQYNLIRERRKTNDTLVLWVDGKAQEVPAWDIPLPEDGPENEKKS